MISDKLVQGIAAVAVLLVISVFLGFGIAAILACLGTSAGP